MLKQAKSELRRLAAIDVRVELDDEFEPQPQVVELCQAVALRQVGA